ncbi:MAG TPA: serine/threonine-protein kinase [Planctomycetota bacterium]|nr:serine/threonine-protein kinase [Planctomycetota bacterium]
MIAMETSIVCRRCSSSVALILCDKQVNFCPFCGEKIAPEQYQVPGYHATDSTPVIIQAELSPLRELTRFSEGFLCGLAVPAELEITEAVSAPSKPVFVTGSAGVSVGETYLSPGTRMADSEIVRFIGRGGMGHVYEVQYVGDDASQPRCQALKVLTPELAQSSLYVERFLKESVTAIQLNHAGIVKTFAAGWEPVLFLRMEMIRGGTVRNMLSAPLQLQDAVEVVMQVGNALSYAHGMGMVHRDVKPENILIDDSDGRHRYLLSDFGLIKELVDPKPEPVLSLNEFQAVCDKVAKALNELNEEDNPKQNTDEIVNGILSLIDKHASKNFGFEPSTDPLTAFGHLADFGNITKSIGMHQSECLGTPLYMSPEQIEGRRTDGRCDIYALGATFFELLTGHPPFNGTSARDVFVQKLTHALPPLQDQIPAAKWNEVAPFSQIIEFMMAKDRRCRYRHIDFCLKDVARTMNGQTPWCSNSRFLYDAAVREYAGLEEDDETTSSNTIMLLNLLHAVFEMA